jgi:hypothetical protein
VKRKAISEEEGDLQGGRLLTKKIFARKKAIWQLVKKKAICE